ncbi:hypothetical protein ECANGB1_2794 [Enterospora canceri]|uniref:Protein kish n=1 Tax=Enterospora canceri TaxID=1081671 RepID=A0A1Y1S7B3_9MICR|nr:hypothetical protein ECANGB1_2794 [Enterospora canceri]
MSALTSFDAFIRALLLLVVTVTVAQRRFPSFFEKKEGTSSIYTKLTIVGERLSLYVSLILLYHNIRKFVGFFV